MYKVLKNKDRVLEKNQIKNILIKIASNNTITTKSSRKTYPIPRLKENGKYIYLVYTLLSEHVKMGIPIHPAGEWILDNYYIIEKAIKTIYSKLTLKKYCELPGLSENGFASVYVLANEIISNTDAKFNTDDIIEYIQAYQTYKKLKMEEIWSIGIFLEISIIEKIRSICEKIFISQMRKTSLSMI